MDETFPKAKVLVTGANGFIGFNLALRLLDEGANVTALISPASVGERIKRVDGRPNFRILTWDLRGNLEKLFSEIQFDFVFHLAAEGITPKKNQVQDMLAVNVGSVVNMSRLVSRQGGKMIWTGSVFELGGRETRLGEDAPANPSSFYAWTKAAAFDYLKRFALPGHWVALRPFGVYGPYEASHRLLPYVIGQLTKDRPALLTRGTQIRDFVFVDDVVEAIILAACTPEAEEKIYNIGSGRGVSVREVAQKAATMLGKELLVEFGTKEAPASEPNCYIADPSLAQKDLGWTPATDLDAGIKKTIEWYMAEEART